MDKIKKKAKQYISDRDKTAWVYQVRRVIDTIGIDEVTLKKDKNKNKNKND